MFILENPGLLQTYIFLRLIQYLEQVDFTLSELRQYFGKPKTTNIDSEHPTSGLWESALLREKASLLKLISWCMTA